MSDDSGTLRAVSWQEAFPGLRLFSALRMALSFALVLAAVALVGTAAGWRLIGSQFSNPQADPNIVFEVQVRENNLWPWEVGGDWLATMPLEPLTSPETWRHRSPLVLAWNSIAAPFEQIFSGDATFVQAMYWLLCALWSLVVWSFFGGAISRMAAVSFTRQETLPWGKLAGFVRSRFGAYFVAPLFPLLGTFLMAAFLAVIGLVMRTDVGVLVGGIVWPVVLLVGFMMAFLLLGLFFGWPLMWLAVSAEGTDSFGALSHSYSYTYQRPLQYLMYAVAAALIGLLGWYLITLLAVWIINLGYWGVSWGTGGQRIAEINAQAEMSTLAEWGRTLIGFWNNVVRTLALAFVFSYFWSATTVIYFLLRRLVDATELDEVYVSEEQEQHGLPPLKTGPDGVPEVADEPVIAGEG